ncbi:unnamed protein product [Effrenium voratum]|uniref:Secreted protein n=1 Tax=Effrenium voratum TaxID=2562239 RepID=A0AA36HQX1_9DINO|nr:unnamed protein product [Effrenium voratum]
MALNAFLPVLVFLALDVYPPSFRRRTQPQPCCINIVTNSRIAMWCQHRQRLLSSKILLSASCSCPLSDSSTGWFRFVCPVCSCLNVSASYQSSSLSWQSRIRAPGHEVIVLKRASWDLGVLGYVGFLAQHALHLHSHGFCIGSCLAPQLSLAVVAAGVCGEAAIARSVEATSA